MYRRIKAVAIAFFIVFSLFSVAPVSVGASSIPYQSIGEYWSPKIYHEVDFGNSSGYRSDIMTKANYDGDWIGNNNWENFAVKNSDGTYKHKILPYVYFGAQETYSHYFLHYGFFHPRDSGGITGDHEYEYHENDFEGILLVVKKDGSTYGKLQAMMCMAHDWLNWYDLDELILANGHHPEVYVEASGHGAYAMTTTRKAYFSTVKPNDFFVFSYNSSATLYEPSQGSFTTTIPYKLVSYDELWDRQYNDGINGQYLFDRQKFGCLDGDNFGNLDKANLPWDWKDNDLNDNDAVPRGVAFTDPALALDIMYDSLGTISHTYIYNPYYSHKVTLKRAAAKVNTDGWGSGTTDLYLKMRIGTTNFIDDKQWMKDNVTINSMYNIYFGKDDASEPFNTSTYVNTVYVAQFKGQAVKIETYDSNAVLSDERLDTFTITPTLGQTITVTKDGPKSKVELSIYAKNL